MASLLDTCLNHTNVITEVNGHTSAIARLESDMTQVLKRLSAIEEWMSVCKQRHILVSRDNLQNDITLELRGRENSHHDVTPVSRDNTHSDIVQVSHDNADSDVTPMSRDHQVADKTLTPLIEQCRCIYARLSALKKVNGNQKYCHATEITAPKIPSPSAENNQREDHFRATIEALQLQLAQVIQNTRPIQLNKESIQTHQRLLQQAHVITGHPQVAQQFKLQSLINALYFSSVASSKFQQLELLVNSNCIVYEHELYKTLVDILTEDLMISKNLNQLEAIANTLAQNQNNEIQEQLNSTKQQQKVLKELCSKLKVLDAKRKQLQAFIDNCTQVSDPALRRTLDSQQVVVKTMKREIDSYRQNIRARMTSEMDTLRQTLADVAVNTILASLDRTKARFSLTTVELHGEIVIDQLETRSKCVDILSVSSSGELLVASTSDRLLYVYDTGNNGQHLSSIPTYRNDSLYDATWTPQGNIVYTSETNSTKRNKVVTLTRNGDVIAQTKLNDARRLSVSADGAIYVACAKDGVYQSTDDGVTWCHAFKSPDRCELLHVIKVSTDFDADTFWSIETKPVPTLREYTLEKSNINNNNKLKWRKVALTDGEFRSKWNPIQMAFDGRTNLFAMWLGTNNRTKVLAYSGGANYERILDLSDYVQEECEDIVHLAVNHQCNTLCLSLALPGVVKVFTLTYE